jgi:pyruvate/2-oxoglutarate dehydrogenase complex dihydrolipoamide acyltransferase (E2) component
VETVVIPGRECDPAGGGLFAGLIRRQWPTGLYCGAASTCARDKPRQSTDLRRARIRSPARRDNEAMKLPVSAFDHRIVDGAQAAALLCELRDLIESPELALLDL